MTATTHPDGADAHGHDHSTSKAPWLILLPVLVLLLVAPPALGADAVARNASSQGLAGMDVVAPANRPAARTAPAVGGGYKFNDGSGSATDSTGSRRTDALPGAGGHRTRPVTMKDFILRALYDADNSVKDTPVTVTGFIAPAGRGLHRRLHHRPDGDQLLRRRRQPDATARRRRSRRSRRTPGSTRWSPWCPNTATMDNGYVPTVTLTSATSDRAAGRPVRALSAACGS